MNAAAIDRCTSIFLQDMQIWPAWVDGQQHACSSTPRGDGGTGGRGNTDGPGAGHGTVGEPDGGWESGRILSLYITTSVSIVSPATVRSRCDVPKAEVSPPASPADPVTYDQPRAC